MKKTVAADVVIFGGGIAGLWLLSRVRQSGLSAILFETGTLGGAQTHKAQGIIHGGMKYALQGRLTTESRAMTDMPARWRACLSGQGEIDLSSVPILSSSHCLWSPTKFTSKLTGFLASTTLSSTVTPLTKEHYPSVFQSPAFKGEVFALDEIVLDVPALVRELVKQHQDAIFKIDPLQDEAWRLDQQGNIASVQVASSGETMHVEAQRFIFTAGAGNEALIKPLKMDHLAMQRRPLHMVLVRMPYDHALYAHCLGLGTRPRLTVTTHYTEAGETIWYLGGQLSEEGVGRTPSAQIKAAQHELNTLFPWLDFSSAVFSTFTIDRAEPQQKGGLKPDSSFANAMHNMIMAWPTKLALAPKLADDILLHLQSLSPRLLDVHALRAWPMPPLARPVWEEAFCKSVA